MSRTMSNETADYPCFERLEAMKVGLPENSCGLAQDGAGNCVSGIRRHGRVGKVGRVAGLFGVRDDSHSTLARHSPRAQ